MIHKINGQSDQPPFYGRIRCSLTIYMHPINQPCSECRRRMTFGKDVDLN